MCNYAVAVCTSYFVRAVYKELRLDVVGYRGIRKSKRLETTGLSRFCTQFTGAAEEMAGLPLSANDSFGRAAGSRRGKAGPVFPSPDS